ncbi:hypothetical protein HPB47_000806 [Ixodes persulcatus]|uniref:Uncharacterized protein n=1 Tax=Ixodes persulcatus TaxID=34615 RepID=A0AC60PS95_IXOPE|nr:hypothetical protein HPB47_000806 [Ixodes persulcatus]
MLCLRAGLVCASYAWRRLALGLERQMKTLTPKQNGSKTQQDVSDPLTPPGRGGEDDRTAARFRRSIRSRRSGRLRKTLWTRNSGTRARATVRKITERQQGSRGRLKPTKPQALECAQLQVSVSHHGRRKKDWPPTVHDKLQHLGAQKAESNMNGGSEGSATEGQASTVPDTRTETGVVALRRLELEFEMQKLRLESEETIALRKPEVGANCERPERGLRRGRPAAQIPYLSALNY